MQIFSGTPLLDQAALGRLHFYRRPTPVLPVRSHLTWQEERDRFQWAQRRAVEELKALYDQALDQVGEYTASIFAIHSVLVTDESLTASVLDLLRTGGHTAEQAILTTGLQYCSMFSALEDPYMRDRAADVHDIARRMISLLIGLDRQVTLEDASILVADEFLPSEIMSLEGKLLGLIAWEGSQISHSAMLARAYHIPTLVHTHLGKEWDGHMAVLDGHMGKVYLDPDQLTVERLCGAPTERAPALL